MHLKTLGIPEHNQSGPWEVRLHDEFAPEFGKWTEGVQDAVLSLVLKLRAFGPSLGRPSVDTLKGSDFPNMKELRLHVEDGVWRIAFAFDPKRRAILLVGGDMAAVSKERFYSALIRVADSRYRRHLTGIDAEGKKR